MLTEKMDQGDPPKHLALRMNLRRKKKKQRSQYVNKSSQGEIIINELFYFIFLKTTCQTTERKRKREKHGRHSGSGACHILICIKITCVGQSVTYLPFQSVTRMQYQQNKETKKKRQEEGMFSAAIWEKDNDLFQYQSYIFVQRLTRNNQTPSNPNKMGRKKKSRWKIRMILETT